MGLAAAALGGAVWATGALESLELDLVDTRFEVRGSQAPPDDVVFVALDQESLSELGRFPFPRSLHGRVIERLARAGARVIAYDIEFSEPSPDPAEDAALVRDATRAGNVVLGTTAINRDTAQPVVFPGLRRIPAGDASFDERPDGVFRRLKRLAGAPPFAEVAARRAWAQPADLDGDGAWIDFAGPPGTLRRLGFADVARGDFDPEAVRDKVVVVGASATSLQDEHPTAAGGGPMSGGEIQANAIATLLEGVPLRDAPVWAGILGLLVGGLAPPLAGAATRPARALLASLLAAAAAVALLLVAGQLLFDAGWVLPLVPPLAAAVAGAIGAVALTYATELRRRRRVRAAFERFAPREVVGSVLERAGDDLRLPGERLDATVLFCDLHGFTAWAEELPAERVIAVLDRFLGEMGDAILDEEGTLVSYLGDGLLAVFGAPLARPDHADRALRAARELVGPRLARVNEAVEGDFRLGVALHTGPVASGTVGTERRMEYAAVGDTTNVAARLQAVTRERDSDVLLTQATVDALRERPPDLAEAGEVALRGRRAPVRAWTLRQPQGPPEEPA